MSKVRLPKPKNVRIEDWLAYLKWREEAKNTFRNVALPPSGVVLLESLDLLEWVDEQSTAGLPWAQRVRCELPRRETATGEDDWEGLRCAFLNWGSDDDPEEYAHFVRCMALIGIGPGQCRHVRCRADPQRVGYIEGPSPAERAHLEESDLICLAGRDPKLFKIRLELCMDSAVFEQLKWRWGHGALLLGVAAGAETFCSHFAVRVDPELIEKCRNDPEHPAELAPWEAMEGLNMFPHAMVVGDRSEVLPPGELFDIEEQIPNLFGITWWQLQKGGGLVWSTSGLVEPVRRWLVCVEKRDAAAAETSLSWFTPPPKGTGILVALEQAGLDSQEALKRQQSRAVRAQHARERAEEEIVLANLESEMNETAANRAACTALMGEAKLLLDRGDTAGALVRYRLAAGKDRFRAEAHAWRARAAIRLAVELSEEEDARKGAQSPNEAEGGAEGGASGGGDGADGSKAVGGAEAAGQQSGKAGAPAGGGDGEDCEGEGVGAEGELEATSESAVQRPYLKGQESLHMTREDMINENEQYEDMSLQGKRGVELSVEVKKAAQMAEEARSFKNRPAVLEEAVSAANSALVQSGGRDSSAWVLRGDAFLMAGSQLEATLDFEEGHRADPSHRRCRELWLEWQGRNREIRQRRLKMERTWEAMGKLEQLRATSQALSLSLDSLGDWPLTPLATWQWHTLLYNKAPPAPQNMLTHLTLDDMPVGPDGAEVMAKALAKNGTLERLTMRSCRLRPAGVQAIARALTSNGHLLSLDLSYNAARDAGAKELWCAMAVNKRLEELVLRGNFIRDEGFEEMHRALSPEDSPLLKIDAGGNLLEWPGVRHIAKALHTSRMLEELGLSGCSRLASDAVHRLSVVALEHPRMRRLDLRGAHISRTAVVRLRRRARRRHCEIALAIDNVTVLSTDDSDDDEADQPVLWEASDAPDPDDLDAIDVDSASDDGETAEIDPASAMVLHPTKALPDERPSRGLVMEEAPDDKLDQLGVATRDLY